MMKEENEECTKIRIRVWIEMLSWVGGGIRKVNSPTYLCSACPSKVVKGEE